MSNDKLNFKEFPTTRYQGSKRKILPWIHEIISQLEFETALDACGGSGIVSYLLKRSGKSVTYNDKLRFNYIIGKALIENKNVIFLEEDLDNLFESIRQSTQSFIQETFNNIYYLPAEDRWLDGINNGIINMNHYTGETLEYKKALAYYALFQACLIKRPFNLFHRKNLKLRTNEVERNFGNKITWDRPFQHHFREFIKEINSMVFDSGVDCFATNQSIFDINEDGYDLTYIDPPYLKGDGANETSDYLKCYHFLEGMSNYQQWKEMIDMASINRRFANIVEQNDFTKETIHENFHELIRKFRHSTIVISYKKGGSPSIRHIVDLMKRYKTRVYTRSLHYKYALNKQNDDVQKNREVLIIGV